MVRAPLASAGTGKGVPPSPRRKVDGILLLDKPRGVTSNRALQTARHLYRAEKAGHTGSLDPLATGLLPVCFGEATKIAGYLLGSRKAYLAECRLGVTTDTDDADGAILRERAVPAWDEEAIRKQLATLTGRVVQIPPAYSALKQQGVAFYKRARRGEAVTPPPREVEVQRFELLERLDGNGLRLHVECGSGTYVRSLVRDLGEALGCGAHLIALRRLWVEPFSAPRMLTLEKLESLCTAQGLDALDACLLPLEAGLTGWPTLPVDEADRVALAHGRRIGSDAAPGRYRVDGADGRVLALVETDGSVVRVLRGFSPYGSVCR